MLRRLLRFAVYRPAPVLLVTLGLLALAAWSAAWLPLDAVPDLSPVQVEILTPVPDLAPEEGENAVTRPIERELAGLPGLAKVRSLTRFGISQVILLFQDNTDVLRARQLVAERLPAIVERLPRGLAPRLSPPTTGLGEIFTYALRHRPGAPGVSPDERTRLTELKTLQDFVVRPALRAVPGIADVNTTGGFDRALVIEPDPDRLAANGLDLNDVADAVARNVSPGGGAVLDRPDLGRQQTVRSGLRVQTPADLAGLTVKVGWGATPVLLREVAEVQPGARLRTGAATLDGQETVLGTALMLAGENGRAVARRFAAAVRGVGRRLPANVEIVPLLDRARFVDGTVRTVRANLLAGAVLVAVVLFGFLNHWRAALLVAAVIPAAFGLGLAGLRALGFSGNLLSLGAIDFGLLVDGAVVFAENAVRRLAEQRRAAGGREPDGAERRRVVLAACREVAAPTVAGVAVITAVYLPVFGLEGVEGKMFAPLAAAAVLSLLAALALALSAVPALLGLFLNAGSGAAGGNRLVAALQARYRPLLAAALRHRGAVLGAAAILAGLALMLALNRGGEFLPRLDENTLVVEIRRPAGGSLEAAVAAERAAERAIVDGVPEIAEAFSRLGQSDIATDPQSPDENDLYITFKSRAKWRPGIDRETLSREILARLAPHHPGATLSTNQPIALRFDELLEGVRADVAVKVFGPDAERLDRLARAVRDTVAAVPGAGEVALEEVGRVDTLEIVPDREALRRFQATAAEVDGAVATGLGGREVGRVEEGETFYPILVRLPGIVRQRPDVIAGIPFRSAERSLLLNVGQVARTRTEPRLGTFQHENGERRRALAVNVAGRDAAGFAAEARRAVRENVPLPAGYRVEFGGAFENFRRARVRLAWLVPVLLAGMFAVCWAALGSAPLAGVVFAGVPLALAGGVFALALRGMPWTVPALIGLVAVAGVATLNGLVLAAAFRDRRRAGEPSPAAAVGAALERLRPVLMTALVAAGGFVPMAWSTAPGAEVQRPLATTVIGGILSATALTLFVVPMLLAGLRPAGGGVVNRVSVPGVPEKTRAGVGLPLPPARRT